jgi:hypothetical protein
MLTDRQKAILNFCTHGKKSREITKYFQLGVDSIYLELRLLQRLGLIQKTAAKSRAPAVFTTVGTEPALDGQYERDTDLYAPEYDPELVNVEFIRHSHNIFARAA